MKFLEYAIIMVLTVVASIGALTIVGGTFDDVFRAINNLLY